MAENPTIQELQTAKAILAHEVDAAVSAILLNPGVRAFPMSNGFVLNLMEAIAANRVATMILRDVHASERHRRNAVRTAILMARPEKG